MSRKLLIKNHFNIREVLLVYKHLKLEIIKIGSENKTVLVLQILGFCCLFLSLQFWSTSINYFSRKYFTLYMMGRKMFTSRTNDIARNTSDAKVFIILVYVPPIWSWSERMPRCWCYWDWEFEGNLLKDCIYLWVVTFWWIRLMITKHFCYHWFYQTIYL